MRKKGLFSVLTCTALAASVLAGCGTQSATSTASKAVIGGSRGGFIGRTGGRVCRVRGGAVRDRTGEDGGFIRGRGCLDGCGGFHAGEGEGRAHRRHRHQRDGRL